MWGGKTLDHFYSTHRNGYKALPRHPFCKSILLLSVYKQKLKREVPVMRSIRKWSDETDARLQACFTSADWGMFQDSSESIEELTTSVMGFVNKRIDNVIPAVTIQTYPKSWRLELPLTRNRTRAHTRKSAMTFTGSDTRNMWQGFQMITDYKGKPICEMPSDAFYACFEECNNESCVKD
jgi:hypothetical protein